MQLRRCFLRSAWFGLLFCFADALNAQITTAPKQGIRENDPRLHALTNARIVTAPGKTIEKGTILIRDGVIVAAGADVKVPADARGWDLAGRTIYTGFIDVYRDSLMGSIALIRQNLLDASWYQAAQDAYHKNPGTTERPESNASLAALAEQAQRKQPTVFEADDELELLRALRIADEFKLKPLLFGNGYEYRLRKALAEKKTPIILPLDFPKPPEIERPDQALEVELDELQHWDRAPSNPARLAEAGIPFAFTTQKLEKPEKDFWSRLRL